MKRGKGGEMPDDVDDDEAGGWIADRAGWLVVCWLAG